MASLCVLYNEISFSCYSYINSILRQLQEPRGAEETSSYPPCLGSLWCQTTHEGDWEEVGLRMQRHRIKVQKGTTFLPTQDTNQVPPPQQREGQKGCAEVGPEKEKEREGV